MEMDEFFNKATILKERREFLTTVEEALTEVSTGFMSPMDAIWFIERVTKAMLKEAEESIGI